ncbi:hypothetical protein SDRG_15162 [Saprolegnia diclina VS20]|uniref:Uncharacterized protein n=1 Tax=Saprolegnia diclina (strain VS20) TaxID=1156394 RepID=T0R4P2_SAPDV|nr:hypothetical protein SDRG_15162 [Saprolegnia diclina VS20]EQC27048.1 hypothetical protein SDRG_15162 [Saprolegnia diclina VS20]|eukprot:XP_008619548.1 hypothetical protein SDRG_15162 [Saprolegnia diclina VS20]
MASDGYDRMSETDERRSSFSYSQPGASSAGGVDGFTRSSILDRDIVAAPVDHAVPIPPKAFKGRIRVRSAGPACCSCSS